MFVKYYFTVSSNLSGYIFCIRAHVYKNGKVHVVPDDDSKHLLEFFTFDNLNYLLIEVLRKGLILYAVRFPEEVK